MYERLAKFREHLLKEDGSPNRELFKKVEGDATNDYEIFLLERVFEFARYSLVDAAVNTGRWFSEFSSQPENFLRDVGCVLAEAGRSAWAQGVTGRLDPSDRKAQELIRPFEQT